MQIKIDLVFVIFSQLARIQKGVRKALIEFFNKHNNYRRIYIKGKIRFADKLYDDKCINIEEINKSKKNIHNPSTMYAYLKISDN